MKKSRLFWLSFLMSTLVLLLGACGGTTPSSPQGGTSPSASHEVQVILKDFQITSSVTTFSPEVAYHFVVVNQGKINHEFMVTPTDTMPGMSMDEMHRMSLAVIDDLAPGATKTVDATFPQADAGKGFEFSCHLAGHYEAGMKLPITIAS